MEATPDPGQDGERAPRERRHDVEVQVRRTPRYGTFIAIGAVLGAVAAWVTAMLMPPAVDELGRVVDTTAVIGLVIVAGFVVGAGLGGLVAVIIDRSLAKRSTTLVAEQTDVEEPDAPVEGEPLEDEAPAVEAAFEPLDGQGSSGASADGADGAVGGDRPDPDHRREP
ncbi:hypothetical protein [Agrococcus sp. Marseille-P2731]|uniref:hypothetical protein n=1 Tax=Agrococcus sp. Marseille-P2731 TaxID=1841862 RepID=UPI0009311179|nr:hypothetical protein [Agrococcus sp. Marseille-P2731]